MKRFSLTASIRDRLTTAAAFELSTPPYESAMSKLPAGVKVDGNAAHVSTSMDADEVQKQFAQISASPFGKCLGVLLDVARYLPVHESAASKGY